MRQAKYATTLESVFKVKNTGFELVELFGKKSEKRLMSFEQSDEVSDTPES
jgi:hypothetical protein